MIHLRGRRDDVDSRPLTWKGFFKAENEWRFAKRFGRVMAEAVKCTGCSNGSILNTNETTLISAQDLLSIQYHDYQQCHHRYSMPRTVPCAQRLSCKAKTMMAEDNESTNMTLVNDIYELVILGERMPGGRGAIVMFIRRCSMFNDQDLPLFLGQFDRNLELSVHDLYAFLFYHGLAGVDALDLLDQLKDGDGSDVQVATKAGLY